MAEKREFHITALLSVTTGILCGNMDGLYDILNFMTNDDLFTHQLIRGADEAAPYLREQHPWLRDVSADDLAGAKNADGVARLIEQHGEYHEVIPMHFEDHEQIDPIEELKRMKPDANVIEINLDEPISPYGNLPPNN